VQHVYSLLRGACDPALMNDGGKGKFESLKKRVGDSSRLSCKFETFLALRLKSTSSNVKILSACMITSFC